MSMVSLLSMLSPGLRHSIRCLFDPSIHDFFLSILFKLSIFFE